MNNILESSNKEEFTQKETSKTPKYSSINLFNSIKHTLADMVNYVSSLKKTKLTNTAIEKYTNSIINDSNNGYYKKAIEKSLYILNTNDTIFNSEIKTVAKKNLAGILTSALKDKKDFSKIALNSESWQAEQAVMKSYINTIQNDDISEEYSSQLKNSLTSVLIKNLAEDDPYGLKFCENQGFNNAKEMVLTKLILDDKIKTVESLLGYKASTKEYKYITSIQRDNEELKKAKKSATILLNMHRSTKKSEYDVNEHIAAKEMFIDICEKLELKPSSYRNIIKENDKKINSYIKEAREYMSKFAEIIQTDNPEDCKAIRTDLENNAPGLYNAYRHFSQEFTIVDNSYTVKPQKKYSKANEFTRFKQPRYTQPNIKIRKNTRR